MREHCLETLGWSQELEREFEHECVADERPARVVAPDRGYVDVLSEQGSRRAMLTGPARFDPPTVGDWVLLLGGDPPTVRARLSRKSELRRKVVGGASRTQCIAANVDIVFVVTDHGQDFNLRRLERYVTATQDGGARPIVILNKADDVADPRECEKRAARAFPGVRVLSVSALEAATTDSMLRELSPGATAVLVGSSGVGKSTLTNALTGQDQETRALGSVGKGRHTTTSRQMFALPGGGWLIDTPGMREFGLGDIDQASVDKTFEDVQSLADACRFGDCRHDREPGCAVQAAIQAGKLLVERLRSYEKLQREVSFENSRADEAGRRVRKQEAKEFAKKYRKPNQVKAKRRGDT